MALDFTKLDTITYKGAKTAQERQERDALLAEGFTIVEDKTPFEEPQLDMPTKASVRPPEGLQTLPFVSVPPEPPRPTERKLEPFMSNDGRNYRALYREACNFHERHKMVEDTEEYWVALAKDMGELSGKYQQGKDSFLNGLLMTIMEELEAEVKRMRASKEKAPAPREPYKAGAEVEVFCYDPEEAKKLKALLNTGEAELIGQVVYHSKERCTYLHYKLLVDESQASGPLPNGSPRLIETA